MKTTPTRSLAPMRAKLRERRDLTQAMYFHRLNVRELAELCGSRRHQSTISHLHSGARDTCDVYLARRIEEVLRLAPGSLFTPVSRSDNLVAAPFPTTPRRRKQMA